MRRASVSWMVRAIRTISSRRSLDLCSIPLPIIERTAEGVVLSVRVIPRASKPGIAGTRDDALLVRLASPPVEGAANDELIDLIASCLGIARRQISIVSGVHGRRKRLKVIGTDASSVAASLAITVS
jgi:uncharacterized protein (TIGR00251 family)